MESFKRTEAVNAGTTMTGVADRVYYTDQCPSSKYTWKWGVLLNILVCIVDQAPETALCLGSMISNSHLLEHVKEKK